MRPPPEEERSTFWRNVFIIAALHVALISGLWLYSLWKKESARGDAVTWLDGGGLLAGNQQSAEPTPEPEDTPQDEDTPTPAPAPEPMDTPQPQASQPPSL
ncbi:MAG TPA: hypothetical protein VHY22_00505, partial [Chthoniobacteraceae bacterium]|nr:hypothetical protein [Chthoniobacteraceae bacterium]